MPLAKRIQKAPGDKSGAKAIPSPETVKQIAAYTLRHC